MGTRRERGREGLLGRDRSAEGEETRRPLANYLASRDWEMLNPGPLDASFTAR